MARQKCYKNNGAPKMLYLRNKMVIIVKLQLDVRFVKRKAKQ